MRAFDVLRKETITCGEYIEDEQFRPGWFAGGHKRRDAKHLRVAIDGTLLRCGVAEGKQPSRWSERSSPHCDEAIPAFPRFFARCAGTAQGPPQSAVWRAAAANLVRIRAMVDLTFLRSS